MKLFIVLALVAVSMAEPPVNYGAPSRLSSSYSSPARVSSSYGAPSSGGYSSSSSSGGYSGSSSGGYRQSRGGPYVSDPDLALEDEGRNIPNEIIDQELLNKVVDAVSQDLAQQAAARAAQNQAYGVPSSGYGAPSSAYGAPSGYSNNGGNNGRIQLLIPPDPLKAKLIANYVQSPEGSPSAFGGGSRGGYSQSGYN